MRIPLDHAAFLTWDTAATHAFYTKVMGWPLATAWGRKENDPPFFITGYDAGGWLIEFEEQVGTPRPDPPPPGFPHFGLLASSRDELAAWRDRLDEHAVEYLDLEHELMFTDPNNVTFQVFCKEQWHGTPEELAPQFASNLESWLSFRTTGAPAE